MNYKRIIALDKKRYGKNGAVPPIQKYLRRAQYAPNMFTKLLWKKIYMVKAKKMAIEVYPETQIGEGLYLGHFYGVTINPQSIIGKNCNLHRGVLIGKENRGKREGTPIIGDNVWIGINATIIGKIKVGNDVLIAPNTFVNCDIPDHSVVFGNPCIIKRKEFATHNYINNIIDQ